MLSSLWKTPDNLPKVPNSSSVGLDPAPAAPLASQWAVRSQAGEPFAAIRVRNLQSSVPVGRDAWGRAGRHQPLLLSSEVVLARPFSSASEGDIVDEGTVHYGTLSKTLLGTLDLWGQQQQQQTSSNSSSKDAKAAAAAAKQPPSSSLSAGDVLELLWVRMTGFVVDGSRRELPLDQVPFLDAARLRSLSITLLLPKASLLGCGGVSLTTTACFRRDLLEGDDDGEGEGEGGDDKKGKKIKNPLASYSRTLKIGGLHVPTLIGVNDNERKAKQMLVADIEIDRFDVTEDIYSDLEKMVFEEMESSCFETLEALAAHLANKILHDFRLGGDDKGDEGPKTMRERGWQVRVCLEKPIAVPFAECPSIEVKMGNDLP